MLLLPNRWVFARRFVLFVGILVAMDLQQTMIVFFGIVNLTFAAFLYINSKGSTVVRLYSLISVFATLWSLSTLLTSHGVLPFEYFKYAVYGHYVFGYLAYLSFFWFALLYPVPPSKKAILRAVVLSVWTIGYLVFIPSPFFATIQPSETLGQSLVFNIPGYAGFVLMLSGVFFAGLLILLKTQRDFDKTVLFKDLDRYQIYFALMANFVAGTLGIVFNLIFPLYGDFNWFYVNPILVTGALMTIGLYNILRYNFFNSRIVLAEFFTGGILILSLTRFILSPPGTERILDGILLIVMTGFGVFLIQSVFREVKLLEQLELANQQQESLLHFISHEIKGYLTKNEAAFAAISGGDYGAISDDLSQMSKAALIDTRKGVDTVIDILDAANLKRGTVAYKNESFDLVAAIEEVVADLKNATAEKGVELVFERPVTGTYTMTGDRDKIRRHVVRNLIDNSIRYTPHGEIRVRLSREGERIRLSVQDTGVGITPEDMAKLFTEGGHGKESIKVNVHSTGYGLFIAKQVVEAHGGKISAESEGKDKGSRFTVEFPSTM